MKKETCYKVFKIISLPCIAVIVLELLGLIPFELFLVIAIIGMIMTVVATIRWKNKYNSYWRNRGYSKKPETMSGPDWETGNEEIDSLHAGGSLWLIATFVYIGLSWFLGTITIGLLP